MRVLQVINSLNMGGAEKLLVESIPVMKEKKLKVEVLLLRGGNQPLLQELKERMGDGFHVLSQKSVYNPFNIFKIIPLIKRYDIVHVHLFPALYWVALANFLSASRVKLVYTEHSTYNKRRGNLIFKFIDRIIYRQYSQIITIAPEVDANLKGHLKFHDDSFELIENGINTRAIIKAPVPSRKSIYPKLNAENFILIQVSSFRYPKDQDTVIKSLNLLPANVVLILIGEGPRIEECKKLVKTLNLNDRVFFLGIKSNVIEYLKASDVAILSSHYEGLSLSCLEGMASGRPLIATDAPGLSSIVKDAGVLFPINEYHELAKRINELLRDKKHYENIVESCLNRARAYDIQITIDKQIRLYKSLLKP
ncbi:glycosyltransferase [Robiginitalea sp. IMCC43444]|uniref:glycosyltransferase n=1 Tax=Robiginitalea sp. IMCC43444 TaxID=3459121 RepID=UPI00404275FA